MENTILARPTPLNFQSCHYFRALRTIYVSRIQSHKKSQNCKCGEWRTRRIKAMRMRRQWCFFAHISLTFAEFNWFWVHPIGIFHLWKGPLSQLQMRWILCDFLANLLASALLLVDLIDCLWFPICLVELTFKAKTHSTKKNSKPYNHNTLKT